MLDASSFSFPSPLWRMNDQNFWFASVLCLRRNIHPFLFPSKLSVSEKLQVMHLITQSLRSEEKMNQLQCLEADKATPWERDILIEHFLLTESIHQAHLGEAFLFDHDLSKLFLINLYDHIIIKVAQKGHLLQEGLSQLIELENEIAKTCSFSFSNEFGFMTSDPRLCGTGLLVQAFLMLPGIVLEQKLGQVLKAKPFKRMICRILVGGIIVLENRYALGVSEEQILTQLETAANHLIVMEMNTYKTASSEINLSLRDKVSRTLGLVLHAIQLTTQEALDAIGILKLGLNMGWIEGISQSELNTLIFAVRKAHMLSSHKTSQTLKQDRALLLKNAVKDLSFRF